MLASLVKQLAAFAVSFQRSANAFRRQRAVFAELYVGECALQRWPAAVLQQLEQVTAVLSHMLSWPVLAKQHFHMFWGVRYAPSRPSGM